MVAPMVRACAGLLDAKMQFDAVEYGLGATRKPRVTENFVVDPVVSCRHLRQRLRQCLFNDG
jgi:hypothetical protein